MRSHRLAPLLFIMGLTLEAFIALNLFASLRAKLPDSADRYHILPGITVRRLIQELNIPEDEAKLIFINGVKAELDAVLSGGERVAIFPPIGGG